MASAYNVKLRLRPPGGEMVNRSGRFPRAGFSGQVPPGPVEEFEMAPAQAASKEQHSHLDIGRLRLPSGHLMCPSDWRDCIRPDKLAPFHRLTASSAWLVTVAVDVSKALRSVIYFQQCNQVEQKR
jgi:hypothetical protein